MAIIGTLVVGCNNATTLGGKSSPLSTSADRERFLTLHRRAAAIITGKNSAANEEYQKTSVPIFIFTRQCAALSFSHPLMQQVHVDRDLGEITRRIDQRIPGDIAVEAGPALLQALIKENVIDEFELSISPIAGDANFIDVDNILNNFEIYSDIEIDGTRLLKCRNKSNTGHGK